MDPVISVGRETLGQWDQARRREWLVTNGIGGYASGTLADSLSRRYHGLLISAVRPPTTRVVTLAKLDGVAEVHQHPWPLSTDSSVDGTGLPPGYLTMERWWLEGTVPVWRYALDECRLERRVFMRYGHNTTYIVYQHVAGHQPLELRLKPLATWRDYHSKTTTDWTPVVLLEDKGARFEAPDGTFWLRWNQGGWVPLGDWQGDFYWPVEAYRGYNDEEHLWRLGVVTTTLAPGESFVMAVSTDGPPDLDWAQHLTQLHQREEALLRVADVADEPPWVQHLVLAADQFLVGRGARLQEGQPPLSPLAPPMDGATVIAGYHWFTDWGRDTMIALPGLTIATGRLPEAAAILRTFARHVDQGMLPNRFVEAGEAPEYNTVDATLWYFDAIGRYWQASQDISLVQELWPILRDIIDWHQRGTRYGIHLDQDGLLAAGEPGVQLTWMDAKVDDWVVTPRQGKPVEINALWYNALHWMARFAEALGEPATQYTTLAERCAASFGRFWYAQGGYLYDVLDTPEGGADPALRPNQIFAVSLPHSPLPAEQQRAVVAMVGRHLWVTYGLRSLARDHQAYVPYYGGDRYARDGAYHQGTTWGWLIGPYAAAVARLEGLPAARAILQPFADHLLDFGMGSIAEIFDADPPHTPRGCIAQAWSVAEVLRIWRGMI